MKLNSGLEKLCQLTYNCHEMTLKNYKEFAVGARGDVPAVAPLANSCRASRSQEMFVDGMALLAAFVGAGFGAAFTSALMRGRRWLAASQAGVGSAVLLNLVTLAKGSRSEHAVMLFVALGLIILSMAALVADRGNRRRNLGGLHEQWVRNRAEDVPLLVVSHQGGEASSLPCRRHRASTVSVLSGSSRRAGNSRFVK